ncbi:MAG: leucyl aminopeptidase, partial [Verrucomicrobia bacterium]|nr:leucyl aminopeptidase [Verrucomicrobiota bacterium]
MIEVQFVNKVNEISPDTIVAEGSLESLQEVVLSHYRFDKYKTTPTPGKIKKVIYRSDNPERDKALFAPMQAIIDGIFFAKNLTSEPANCLYPSAYAERLLELEALGVTVEILDENELAKVGMTALLAVAQGSDKPARVACMIWKGSDQANPIALVGKGVCFDSGGLCIKKPIEQTTMKWDKAAAGTVAGVMKTLALSKSPHYVVAVVGLVENMPDGKAVKPSDVIRTMSGQTVEVVDTDAEGRLVLADCLHYIQKRFNPRVLIDLGTLTQETIASLGSAYAGLYTDDEAIAESLIQSGVRTGDKLWRLPMGEYFA